MAQIIKFPNELLQESIYLLKKIDNSNFEKLKTRKKSFAAGIFYLVSLNNKYNFNQFSLKVHKNNLKHLYVCSTALSTTQLILKKHVNYYTNYFKFNKKTQINKNEQIEELKSSHDVIPEQFSNNEQQKFTNSKNEQIVEIKSSEDVKPEQLSDYELKEITNSKIKMTITAGINSNSCQDNELFICAQEDYIEKNNLYANDEFFESTDENNYNKYDQSTYEISNVQHSDFLIDDQNYFLN